MEPLGISWRDPSTWLPYLYASLLYYLSLIGAHLPRRITGPRDVETQTAKEVTAPAPPLADSSLSAADCNCLTPHLCPPEEEEDVEEANRYVSTLSLSPPKHSSLKKPTASIPSSVSFRSITPTSSNSESESEAETISYNRSIRRSQSVIALVPSGSHVLVGIPKLDWKSESIRIKRTRMSEWLDAEERDVMRQFDEVIRSEEEEDQRTKKRGILKPAGSVRSLRSAMSASKSTVQETPVFVPPPPPPTDSHTMLPRLAILEKSRADEEFGFNLHAERGRGHFIGTVDAGGIGERAGLEQEQRIVGVNGQLIYPNTSHKEVVGLIKKFPMSTTLLVASESVDKYHRDHHIEYSFDHVENKHVEPAPVHDYPVRDASNGFEVPPLNPHSIQVNEEREIQKMTTTTKTEVISTNTASYQYKESSTTYNAYAVPPADSDDLMAQVFNSVPLAPVSNQVTMHSTTRQEEAVEDSSSVSSLTSSHRESAVDVPVDHKYVPSYNSQSHHHETQTHHHQQHQQPSPLSNGSSHGYAASSTSGYDDDDIYHLSAKEARERLRMKNRKHHLHEMSLNEKYQLVSNM